MNNILNWLYWVWDSREQHKVKHLMKDIVAIVFFTTVANVNEWTQIHFLQ